MSDRPGDAEREAVAIAGRAWDRQPNESPKAFEAFATYRDMGYQRSLAAVGWRLHKSRSLLSRWSAAHGWVKRVGRTPFIGPPVVRVGGLVWVAG